MPNRKSRIGVLFFTPISLLLADPRKKLREIMMDFTEFSRFLRRIGDRPQHEPLDEIVDFFNRVSRWHDRGLNDVIASFRAVNYGQWDGAIRALEALDAHFVNAGRNPYGMNRTERGEAVTAGKVFLGGVWGLFTHPVLYWVRQRGEPKGAHPDFPSMNAYDLVLNQARRFMKSHTAPMLELIAELGQVVTAGRAGRRAA